MRILFLSSWFPTPPINGAKIRINNLLRYLVKRYDVTLFSFVNTLPWGEVEAEAAAWRNVCRRVIAVPRPRQKRTASILGYFSPLPRYLIATYSREVMQAIRSEATDNRFDLIVASEVGPAVGMAYYASLMSGYPKVLDCLEIGQLRDNISASTPFILRSRACLTWFKLIPFLRDLLKRFDICTVPSPVEESYIKEIVADHTHVSVIPHGLDLDYLSFSSHEAEPDTMVYTGSLTYLPNRDAVGFFLREIMPQVRRSVPQVRLRVLGENQGIKVSEWPGVDFRGRLADVRPDIWRSCVSIVPLRHGSGTRLKIIESMALGTPVVSTSKGAEGLEVTPDVNVLIADKPAEFAQQTIRLLKDQNLRHRLSENGRKLVEDKYNWDKIGEQFDSLIQSAVDNRRAG